MNSVPVGFFIADVEGLCQNINRLWKEFTGLSLLNAVGIGWIQKVHPVDRERVTTSLKKIIEISEPFYLE
jgi:PAS domain S-box-containing protein